MIENSTQLPSVKGCSDLIGNSSYTIIYLVIYIRSYITDITASSLVLPYVIGCSNLIEHQTVHQRHKSFSCFHSPLICHR